MFKYTNDNASFSPAAKRRSRQAQTDREQLQEITEIVLENADANPNMGSIEHFCCVLTTIDLLHKVFIYSGNTCSSVYE